MTRPDGFRRERLEMGALAPRGLAWVLAALLFLTMAAAPSGMGPELVVNGTFDTDTAGWAGEPAGVLGWHAQEGAPAPGSAQLTISTPNGFGWMEQCIDLSTLAEGTSIQVSGRGRYVDNVTDFSLWASFHSASDCSDPTSGDAVIPFGSGNPDWQQVGTIMTLPAGAMTMRLRFQTQHFGAVPASVLVDDVVAFPLTPTSIQIGEMRVDMPASRARPIVIGGALLLVAGLLVAGAVRRRRG